jgi:hypothetical protein
LSIKYVLILSMPYLTYLIIALARLQPALFIAIYQNTLIFSGLK